MANSFVRYTGNGSTTAYAVPFSYRVQADIAITINGSATTAFSWNGAGTQITFDSAPANASSIEIRRTTSQTARRRPACMNNSRCLKKKSKHIAVRDEIEMRDSRTVYSLPVRGCQGT